MKKLLKKIKNWFSERTTFSYHATFQEQAEEFKEFISEKYESEKEFDKQLLNNYKHGSTNYWMSKHSLNIGHAQVPIAFNCEFCGQASCAIRNHLQLLYSLIPNHTKSNYMIEIASFVPFSVKLHKSGVLVSTLNFYEGVINYFEEEIIIKNYHDFDPVEVETQLIDFYQNIWPIYSDNELSKHHIMVTLPNVQNRVIVDNTMEYANKNNYPAGSRVRKI